jgi:hypothetical protein
MIDMMNTTLFALQSNVQECDEFMRHVLESCICRKVLWGVTVERSQYSYFPVLINISSFRMDKTAICRIKIVPHTLTTPWWMIWWQRYWMMMPV